ncbi:MAG: hypothetical protein ACRDBQ_18245 [Shewanella sp.]
MKNSLAYNELYKNRELFLLDLNRMVIFHGFVKQKMNRFKSVIVVEFGDSRVKETYGFIPAENKLIAFPSIRKARRALDTFKAERDSLTSYPTTQLNPTVLGVSLRGKIAEAAGESSDFAMLSFLCASPHLHIRPSIIGKESN